jgi:hypothetical protein
MHGWLGVYPTPTRHREVSSIVRDASDGRMWARRNQESASQHNTTDSSTISSTNTSSATAKQHQQFFKYGCPT